MDRRVRRRREHPATVRGPVAALAAGLVVTLSVAAALAATGRAAGAGVVGDDPPRERVEVTALTSETTQVFAEPDGTLTATLHLEPVRVRRDGGWVPVDTDLRVIPGGAVAPGAVVTPVTLSGGGAGPLVRLEAGDLTSEVSWPGELPEPVLAGDTAVYRGVLPGVDLRVTVRPTGYQLALAMRGAAPVPTAIRLGLATGGDAREVDDHGGGTVAVDPDGYELRHAWPEAAPAPVAGTAGVSAVDRAHDRLTIHIDRAPSPARAGEAVVPLLSTDGIPRDLSRSGWARVKSGKPGTRYWNSGTVAKVGQCGNWPECNGINIVRSFFQFHIPSVLRDADILGARFNTRMTHTANCNLSPSAGETVLLAHVTPMAHPGPTWGNQPQGIDSTVGTSDAAYGARCQGGARAVGFEVAPAVRSAINRGQSVVNLRLRTRNELNNHGWRKFDAESKVTGTYLTVTYNRPPLVPDQRSADGLGCTGAGNPHYTNSAADILLRARVRDPDGNEGGKVRARFRWYDVDSAGTPGAQRGERVTEELAPGSSNFTARVGRDLFGDGSRFAYRVQGLDAHGGTSAWSGYCHLVVDRTPPDRPPAVSSEHYPEGNQLRGSPGLTGLFTFTANGVDDVARFRYGLAEGDTATPSLSVAASPERDGSQRATVRLTPSKSDVHTVSVQSVDRAGNHGEVYHYTFRVGTVAGAVGHWTLDGAGPDATVTDFSGHGHPAQVHGVGAGVDWIPGRAGDALRFDGSGGHAQTRPEHPDLPERIVYTRHAFTVAAWVRVGPGVPAGWRTAVSQESDESGSFFLQYRSGGGAGEVAFAMPRAASGTAIDRAVAPLPATGRWVHLVGVYQPDNPDGAGMRLYVDGRLAATAGRSPDLAWHQDGPLQVGRGKWQGAWGQRWVGDVDEVQVFNRALEERELRGAGNLPAPFDRGLAGGPLHQAAAYPLNDGGGTLARESSGNHRAAVLAGGASWREGGGQDGGAVLALDGTTGHAATPAAVVRTDGSFTVSAWVNPESLEHGHRTAVSQDGGHHSGFMLGYDHGRCPDGSPCPPGEGGVWAFTIPSADAPAWTGITATGRDLAHQDLGRWVHLAGVLDVAGGQLRLYVDGLPAGEVDLDQVDASRWHAAGGLRIGRAKRSGQPADFFHGAVAGVEVHTGVMTENEIIMKAACFPCRDAVEPTVHTGAVARWVSHTGDSLTTAEGRAPAGYHVAAPLGLPAPAHAAEPTRVLYGCAAGESGGDAFTSADPDCEGQRRLGEIGRAYQEPPEGVGSVPLYRCRIAGSGHPATGHHFDSTDPGCEGQMTEGLLGYLVAYAPLVRYAATGAHWTDTAAVPSHYRAEGVLGLVSTVPGPGLLPLYACPAGASGTFSSLDPGCEGSGGTGTPVGHLWPDPPDLPGHTAWPLHRCRAGEDHFDSLDPACEGQHRDGVLGYVVHGR